MELKYPEHLGDYFEKLHVGGYYVIYAVDETFATRLNKAYWLKIKKTAEGYTGIMEFKDYAGVVKMGITSEENRLFESEEKAFQYIRHQAEAIEKKYSMKLMLKN